MSCRGMVIGWMPVSQRSRTLADRLGFRLQLVGRAGFRRPWSAPLTYPLSAIRSAYALLRQRPRSVVVVAPPVFAPLCVVPLARSLGANVVIDVHSGAMLDRRWRWSVPLLAWAARRGLATVTLPSLARSLARHRVRSLVLPDPLPTLGGDPAMRSASSNGEAGTAERRPRVVAICGWGADEPIETLITAARGASWDLAITGKPRQSLDLPANVTLTGFLVDHAYADLLRSATLIVALTRRDETLLSGAWEALASRRPLAVSATPTLQHAFGPDVACLGPSDEEIRNGIDRVLGRLPDQTAVVARLADQFTRANESALDSLRQALGEGGR
jgi:hypothetical protein